MPIFHLDNFNGGVAEDTYNADRNFYETLQHFDNFSQPGRLRPYRSRIDASDDADFIENLLVASDGTLYGLGADGDTGTDSAKIMEWDNAGDDWDNVSNGTSPNAAAPQSAMFEEFQSYLYFWDSRTTANGTGWIAKWDLAGTGVTSTFEIPATVTTSVGKVFDLPPFGRGPGYRFDKNDRLYIAYAHTLWGIDNSDLTGANEVKLQVILPPEYKIISFSYWQNYLAIGCQHTGRNNASKVFFWNTFDEDPSFAYEIPEGKLEILENLGGNLVAITAFGTGTGSGITGSGVIANVFNGSEFIQARRYLMSQDQSLINIKDASATVKNNQLYFGVDQSDLTTMFRFGNNKNEWCLTPDRNITNDIDEPSNIFAAEFLGDTLFVAYLDGSDYLLTRDDEDKNYDVTAIYRTVWFLDGQKRQKHKLNSVGVAVTSNADENSSSPAARSVEILYRTDFDATFTSLGSIDTDTNMFDELTRETTGTFFPIEFNTIQFELRATGLSQIVEFAFAMDDTPRIYM